MVDADNQSLHEDRYRLLRYDGRVGDVERFVLLMAAEQLWDDLLSCATRGGSPGDAQLLGLLPPHFHHPAAQDWQRWMLSFAAVLGKLAQPAPPPAATMAEQLLVAVLVNGARDLGEQWYRDGLLDGDEPPDPQRFDDWLERYLDDADHELLYDASLDGIDDESTDFQYGFGRMDYEGMFAGFNERGGPRRGIPHPLAPLRMTAREASEEDRVRRAVNELSVSVARAALAGEEAVRPSVAPPNPAGHRLPHSAPGGLAGVGRRGGASAPARLRRPRRARVLARRARGRLRGAPRAIERRIGGTRRPSVFRHLTPTMGASTASDACETDASGGRRSRRHTP